jgi:GTP-binding protein HflX
MLKIYVNECRGKSDVFVENKLFATLDTTVRSGSIKNLSSCCLTVGFIRKPPTMLVDSFKSTLDEVREADLLLHVVDISPRVRRSIASANNVARYRPMTKLVIMVLIK